LARAWAPSLLLVLLLGRPALAAEADSTRSDSLPAPRAALLRSALLPGWGQYYNGHPFKALFFASASTLALTAALGEQRQLDRLSDQLAAQRSAGGSPAGIDSLETRFQNQASKRNTRLLFIALSVAFAAIDAYVDAQLADFDAAVEMEMRPGGALLKLSATLPGR
jgi:hypothetical protein